MQIAIMRLILSLGLRLLVYFVKFRFSFFTLSFSFKCYLWNFRSDFLNDGLSRFVFF